MLLSDSEECDHLVLFHSQAKQKQKGAKHVMLPSVQGYNSKWIVIDYGSCSYGCVFVTYKSWIFIVFWDCGGCNLSSSFFLMCVGKFVVHALDEKARAYFNLESLWTAKTSDNDNSDQVNRFIYFD